MSAVHPSTETSVNTLFAVQKRQEQRVSLKAAALTSPELHLFPAFTYK